MLKKNLLVILGIVYILSSICVSYVSRKERINSVCDFYNSSQVKLVEYMSLLYQSIPENKREDSQVISELFDVDSISAFIYKDNKVIYEKDIETTKRYEKATVRELYNDYKQQGGKNALNVYNHIMETDTDTLKIVKDSSIGEVLCHWQTVKIDGENYIIGVDTPIKKIVEKSRYNEMANFDLACLIVRIIVVLILCFGLWHKNKGQKILN